MDNNINLNNKTSDCIKSTEHFGHTTYVNICDGSTYQRQWGLGDWGIAGAFAIIAIVAVVLVVGLIKITGDL